MLLKPVWYPRLIEAPRNSRTMLDTQKRLLEYAVQRNGRAALAARLRVPLAILDDWMQALTPMPPVKFMTLVEDLLDDFDGKMH